MTRYVSVDVSEFQTVATDAYPHKWLSFRVCDGDHLDHNAGANLAWAVYARKVGKLDGFTVYVVYRPGKNAAVLANLDALHVPTDCVVMIDAESWGGQIKGDRSPELNALAEALRKRQHGNAVLVWGYANRGDYAAIWPTRPAWMGTVIASYGGSEPSFPNKIGWQYTNGQYNVPGLPSSSAPFGKCDHNVFDIGVGLDSAGATPLSTEDDMTPEQAQQLNDLHTWFTGGVGPGQRTAGGTIATTLRTVQAIYNRVMALPTQAGGATIDVNALADALAGELGPNLAKELIDELGKRITP